MTILKEIKSIRDASELAWEMAVDTAGAEYPGGSADRAAEMQERADACIDAYDAAIQCLDGSFDPWELTVQRTQAYLEQARALESDCGDCSHATEALEVLAGYQGA